ncbi:MAG: methionyl-tRNA formyltransferase [Actinomycetaceae bacterium]|nr:methionyl-tRNA formyltransferase [Actinomycetaceae bacterium]
MRIIFAGTPDVALPSLRRLYEDGHDVCGVLTRAPARVGRKKTLSPSPVHKEAEELGIPVFTPHTLKDDKIQTDIRELQPDAIAVVAYGLLVPPALLDVPPHGWLNLHFSLLPSWRGAAPVQHAIAAGDDITGACVFRLEKGLDTGPIIGTMTTPINPDDTSGTLLSSLSVSGAELLSRCFTLLEKGEGKFCPQEGDVSYAPSITTNDARIDWFLPSFAIERHIRAHTPSPSAWTTYDGQRVKIEPVLVHDSIPEKHDIHLLPGHIMATNKHVYVGTGNGIIELQHVIPAGKKRMLATDWARGARLTSSASFEQGNNA